MHPRLNLSIFGSNVQAPAVPANTSTVVEFAADLESYADGAAVGQLTDRTGHGWNATQGTGANKPIFHTAGGNYVQFDDNGGEIHFLNLPDYSGQFTNGAQLYAVFYAYGATGRLWRALGSAEFSGEDSFSVWAGGLYELVGTTARKATGTGTPDPTGQFVLYRVVTRDGLFTASINGQAPYFTTNSNTFNAVSPEPFYLGDPGLSSSMFRLKYWALLNDTTTDRTAELMTRFGL